MNLTPTHFNTFHQEIFGFSQLKKVRTPEEIAQLKKIFQATWLDFKSWQLAVTTPFLFTKIKCESWTNGWKLRTHYWCPYRTIARSDEAPCLATMLNGKNFRIYLMYQHYKSDNSPIRPADYNQKIAQLPTAAQHFTDLENYYIWTSQDAEDGDYLSLTTYLENPALQQKFQSQLNETTTFQVGYFLPSDHTYPDIEKIIAEKLTELIALYESDAA
ncbi:HI_0552 family protein [Enterococcus timonensis]|uniref:HI_0552 family protein n=1 Tax=Enterococcus timonensis TaxID=1852364 RepID=UPI0008DA2986|nr:HI_0552 family protein [Enterococcus timonensis]